MSDESTSKTPTSDTNQGKDGDKRPLPEEKSSVTQHTLELKGQTISYTATTGLTHLRNADEKKTAAIFTWRMCATTSNRAKRPITFCFNGGLAPVPCGCTWCVRPAAHRYGGRGDAQAQSRDAYRQ